MTTAARREISATLFIVGCLVALGIARPIARRFAHHPTAERCAALLSRWSELEARARNLTNNDARPVEPRSISRCATELTDGEVGCALNAGYVDEIERCLP